MHLFGEQCQCAVVQCGGGYCYYKAFRMSAYTIVGLSYKKCAVERICLKVIVTQNSPKTSHHLSPLNLSPPCHPPSCVGRLCSCRQQSIMSTMLLQQSMLVVAKSVWVMRCSIIILLVSYIAYSDAHTGEDSWRLCK